MRTIYDGQGDRVRKPLIGITTWKRCLPTFLGKQTELHTLGVEYVECVWSAGGIPVLLPNGGGEQTAAYAAIVDGLILSGGDDIDPESYGSARDGKACNFDRSVDASEIALVRIARKRNIPTLGICRGAQIVQVAFGGTLLTDIAERYPEHPQVHGSPEEILSLRHPVHLVGDSWLAGIYGRLTLHVNSIHHQCIHSVAEGFRVVGQSPDGLIEALESNGGWWCVCVQWHPEKLPESEHRKIFAEFIQLATRCAAYES